MKQGSSGYTIAELLVAMLLLAFGVLSAAPLFMYAVQGNAVGATGGSVAAAAEERFERLRSTAYVALAVGGSLTSDVAGYHEFPEPDVLVRWRIANNTTIPGTKTIAVRVMHLGAVNRPTPSSEVNLIALRGD